LPEAAKFLNTILSPLQIPPLHSATQGAPLLRLELGPLNPATYVLERCKLHKRALPQGDGAPETPQAENVYSREEHLTISKCL